MTKTTVVAGGGGGGVGVLLLQLLDWIYLFLLRSAACDVGGAKTTFLLPLRRS